jgi:hypothetical protein
MLQHTSTSNRCRCMLEHILKRTRSTYNDVSGMLISMWCFNRCRCMLEHILKRTRSTYNDVSGMLIFNIPDTSLYVLLVRFNICSSIHLHLLKHHIEINIPDTSLYVLLVRFNICSSIHLHLLKHHIEINIPDTSVYVLLVRLGTVDMFTALYKNI